MKATLRNFLTATLLWAGLAAPMRADIRMMVLSDPHVLDTTLFDNGTALIAAAEGEPKLIEHSAELFDLGLLRVAAAAPDLLLIPGDLTKDGEQASHAYVAGKLAALTATHGIRVFVVPGNHDIDNPSSYSYLGDSRTRVPNISGREFRTLYANMGYADAAMLSSDSLSYLTWVNDSLAILGLNSTQSNTTSRASAGGLSTETLDFVDSAMAQVRTRHAQVITMMHHQLTEHFDGEVEVAPTYVINTDSTLFISRDSAQARLMRAGVSTILTGHFHIHSIQRVLPTTLGLDSTMQQLTDISTGALCSWPSPLRALTLIGDTLAVSTDTIGNYQTLAQARNSNTVKGAINQLAPKLYPRMRDLLTRFLTNPNNIEHMQLPNSAAEMTEQLHHYLDEPGLKLLNTLARGEEQKDEHTPDAIKAELQDSVRKYMLYIIPQRGTTLWSTYGLGDGGIIDMMRNAIPNTLIPIATESILQNYTTIGGKQISTEGSSLAAMIAALANDKTPKDPMPDWAYAAPLPFVGTQSSNPPTPPVPTTIPTPEVVQPVNAADVAKKVIEAGQIIISNRGKLYNIFGKRIR